MNVPASITGLAEPRRRKRLPKPIPQDPWALLDAPTVQLLCGMSRTTLWRRIRTGLFPQPDKTFPGDRKAWKRSTVEAWLDSKDPPLRAA